MAKDRRCLDDQSWEVAAMASAETGMAVYSDREDNGLESRMRSKDSCPVWGEGAGKVPDGNSPTPYSTSRTVLGARGGETPPRDSPSVPDDQGNEALALAGRRDRGHHICLCSGVAGELVRDHHTRHAGLPL